MMNQYTYRKRERGATALIIVMFFTLLLTVMSVGFVQLMVQEQRASQDSELSQGAYDSALAGAEDGKRVLSACLKGDALACDVADAGKCDTVSAYGLVLESNGASVIQSNSGAGIDYSQAYTCVIVNRQTKNLVGTLLADSSTIKPLKATGSFDTLVVSWFAAKNSTSETVNLPSPLSGTTLPAQSAWGNTRPPVLRVQLMQYVSNGSTNLSDFDSTSNSSTLYLYPTTAGGSVASPLNFTTDNRRDGLSLPQKTACRTDFMGNGGYACQTAIRLPNPAGGNATNRVAYIRLTAIYNNTDFLLELRTGANTVMFNDAQPSIDSTGKAADVYRRIVERVEMTGNSDTASLYPRATVDTTDEFCKDFRVTSLASDYQNNCT